MYRESLKRVLGPNAMGGLVDDLRVHGAGMQSSARTLFDQWLQVTVDKRKSSVPARRAAVRMKPN